MLEEEELCFPATTKHTSLAQQGTKLHDLCVSQSCCGSPLHNMTTARVLILPLDCCIPSKDLMCLLLFQRLANSKAHTSRFISANLPCNKFKNRLVNIMPYELTRVCLQPIRGVEGSDYINASFIDGYR